MQVLLVVFLITTTPQVHTPQAVGAGLALCHPTVASSRSAAADVGAMPGVIPSRFGRTCLPCSGGARQVVNRFHDALHPASPSYGLSLLQSLLAPLQARVAAHTTAAHPDCVPSCCAVHLIRPTRPPHPPHSASVAPPTSHLPGNRQRACIRLDTTCASALRDPLPIVLQLPRVGHGRLAQQRATASRRGVVRERARRRRGERSGRRGGPTGGEGRQAAQGDLAGCAGSLRQRRKPDGIDRHSDWRKNQEGVGLYSWSGLATEYCSDAARAVGVAFRG